jgi:dTMP kinase
MAGAYITFEGPEGCGKSTQLKMLGERLQKEGYAVLLTKEPGAVLDGTIRAILLNPKFKLHPKTESFLFWGDRIEHHETVVKPALDSYDIVLGDRDYDSSWAYQHYGRGLPFQWMSRVQELAIEDFAPHLTLLYRGDVDHFLKRVGRRKTLDEVAAGESRFDDEQLAFHERVMGGFDDLATRHPQRFRVLDGMLGIDELHEKTYAVTREYLGLR